MAGIRLGNKEEFPQLLDMCKEFWKYTKYSKEVKFDKEYPLSILEMSYKQGLLFVLELGGLQGFVAAIKHPLLGNGNYYMCTEVAYWVNKEHRNHLNAIGLITALEDECEKQGIKYLNMIAMESSTPEKAINIYESRDMIKNETSYTKEVF